MNGRVERQTVDLSAYPDLVRGPMFSARSRPKLHGEPPPAVVPEGEFYRAGGA